MKKILTRLRLPKTSPTFSMILFLVSLFALGWAQWITYEPVIFTFGATILGTMFVLLISTLKSYQTSAIIPGILQSGFFFLAGYFAWLMLENLPMTMQTPAKLGLFTAMITAVNLILTLSGNNSITHDGIFEEDYAKRGTKRGAEKTFHYHEKEDPMAKWGN